MFPAPWEFPTEEFLRPSPRIGRCGDYNKRIKGEKLKISLRLYIEKESG